MATTTTLAVDLLAEAERIRAHALAEAGSDGVDMPVELVRVGEEIQAGGGWETVQVLTLDSWCCGLPPVAGHAHAVMVCTDAHDDDGDAYEFNAGDVVRIRTAVRP